MLYFDVFQHLRRAFTRYRILSKYSNILFWVFSYFLRLYTYLSNMIFILCFVLLSDERVRKKATVKMFTQTRKWNIKKKLKQETHIRMWSCYIYRKVIYLIKSNEETYSEYVYTNMKMTHTKKLKQGTYIYMWSCCIYRKAIYLMKEQGRKLQWKCLHEHANETKRT